MAAQEETSPDFEGLRQRAISDDISNPYLIGTGLKEDKTSELSQEEQIKEIKLNNKHSKALMSTEYEYLKRDPEEEFFMLAVLALKMVHNEEFDESEYVYQVSAGKLFR